MNIDFKSFDYEILGFTQQRPVLLGQPSFRENSKINYDFPKKEQGERGFELQVISQIQIPLQQRNDVLFFEGTTTYLIPDEQYHFEGREHLQGIDEVTLTELLYQHLSRQTAIIYGETFNQYPETKGYIVIIPCLYDLYQTVLNGGFM